jgi:hypothetical protein
MDRLAALILAAATTFAQEPPAVSTRSAELHARREAKARALAPHRQGRVERLLFAIEDRLLLERVLNPPRGVYLRVGGLGEGAGFGAGPGYRHRTEAFDLRVSAAASLKRYAIGEASLTLPGTVKDGTFLELYARRRDFPQEDFFGLGPRSVQEQRTNFALRDTLVRASGGVRARGLTAGVRAGYLQPSIGRGTDTRAPSTDDVFAPDAIPGFLEQPAFGLVEPFVEYGTADPPLNPTKGGRARLSFSRYVDRDLSRFSFNRWDVDVRQYLPFFHRTRTLALRAWLSSSDPDAGHEVPFYLQPTLGGAYSLRGFRTFRFRDRSLALVQAEYRWRINEFVTGALFYDTGAVGARLGDLDRFERDYGFGLRAGGRNGVAFRTDLVFGSGEGTRLLVRFDNVF